LIGFCSHKDDVDRDNRADINANFIIARKKNAARAVYHFGVLPDSFVKDVSINMLKQ
jgi:hypothetical protein